MLRSTVEEAVTVESDREPWELPVREAVRTAREQGRIPVVVVHGWSLPRSESDFEAVSVREGVNGNGRAAPVNSTTTRAA
jgi:hypothetical protein